MQYVTCTVYADDSCGRNGRLCLKIEICPSAREALKRGERPKLCGFDGYRPAVCCPGNNSAVDPHVYKSVSESKSQRSKYACVNVMTIVRSFLLK